MTVLILGAGGQVGSALRWRALARGVSTVGLAHTDLDIADGDIVRAAIEEVRPATVINCAAYTDVDGAETDETAAQRVNRDGAGHIAAACAPLGVPLIHLSTDYVFDGASAAAWREDDPVSPVGVYARTKEAGERAVRDAWGKHVIVRTAWIFGGIGRNFVKTIRRLADQGQTTIRVVDDQRGGPTPAEAIADACLDIAARCGSADIVPWGTYHFCGAPPVTWREFAEAVLADRPEVTVTPCASAAFDRPAPRPANSVLDCTRIRAAFGVEQPDWRPHLKRLLGDLGETVEEAS